MLLAKECPAERPMKSRGLVAPGRRGEVFLAVKPRVMCLHLNEKRRRQRRGGRGMQAELRGPGDAAKPRHLRNAAAAALPLQ